MSKGFKQQQEKKHQLFTSTSSLVTHLGVSLEFRRGAAAQAPFPPLHMLDVVEVPLTRF